MKIILQREITYLLIQHYFLLQLIDIEYMPEFPYKDKKKMGGEKEKAFLKIMGSDSSGANVHAVFTAHCGGGWAFGIGGLCRETPVAFNCYDSTLMSEITTHEIGHVIGNILKE